MATEITAVIVLVIVTAAFALGFHFGGEASRAAADASHAAQLQTLAAAWQTRELLTEAKDQRHAEELDSLRRNALVAAPIHVRVCPDAPRPVVSAGTSGGGGPAAAGLGQGHDDPLPATDLGPFLFAFADRFDRLIADCRQTQPVKDYP